MQVEIQVNDSPSPASRFVTWSAAPCRVRMTDASGAVSSTVVIDLTASSKAGGGQIGFSKAATGAFSKSLAVTVPTSGASVSFFVAGTFGKPSSDAGDISVVAKSGAATVGTVDLMVRIRKDANTLSIPERDRFLAALGTLNNKGTGRFVDFRDMHDGNGDSEMHGHPGFLPWHRAYLLDLERELQTIDPSVTIPYWRFDKAATKLFQPEFMGVPDSIGAVQFVAGHPLEFWTTDGVLGIDREARVRLDNRPDDIQSFRCTRGG